MLTAPAVDPAELGEDFAAAIDKKQLPEAAKALTALHEAAPMARPTERGKLLDLWQAEYNAALELADDPAERLVAGGRFRALADELAPLVGKFPDPDPTLHLKETECLTRAQAYADALDPK